MTDIQLATCDLEVPESYLVQIFADVYGFCSAFHEYAVLQTYDQYILIWPLGLKEAVYGLATPTAVQERRCGKRYQCAYFAIESLGF